MWRSSLKSILIKNVGAIRSQFLSQQIQNYFNTHEKNLGSDADALLDTLIETMQAGILEDEETRKILFMSLEPDSLNDIGALLKIDSKGMMPVQLAEKIATGFELTDKVKEYFEKNLKLEGLFPQAEAIQKRESSDEILEPNSISKDYFELHLYQAELKEKVVGTVKESPDAKMLIRVPTGGGKTRIGLHTVYALQNFEFKEGGLVLWLTYSPVLLDQAHETASKLFPALGKKKTQLRRINSRSRVSLSEEAGIVFANPVVLNRISQADLDQLRARTQLIIFDETHQLIAANAFEFINKMIFKNDNLSILGMTATPARADLGPESARLAKFFDHKFDISVPKNNVLIGDAEEVDEIARERNAIRYLQEIGILAVLKEERHFVTTGELGVLHPDRTKKIVELCELHSSQKKKILVFAESTRDAISLSFLLRLKSIPNELVLGSNKQFRRAAIESYRKSEDMNILVSCDVLTTGFDAPETDVLLIARNTGSVVLYSQILGRALRGERNGGHKENLILHVTDPKFQLSSIYDTFTDYMRYS